MVIADGATAREKLDVLGELRKGSVNELVRDWRGSTISTALRARRRCQLAATRVARSEHGRRAKVGAPYPMVCGRAPRERLGPRPRDVARHSIPRCPHSGRGLSGCSRSTCAIASQPFEDQVLAGNQRERGGSARQRFRVRPARDSAGPRSVSQRVRRPRWGSPIVSTNSGSLPNSEKRHGALHRGSVDVAWFDELGRHDILEKLGVFLRCCSRAD